MTQSTDSGSVDVTAIRWDERGLVPAVVQDAAGKDVLMLAYMNEASLKRTLQTGETWFWSRSRGELWHKGATSGNTQKVRSIHYDCDADTLLVRVDPNGPACHEGTYSCFTRELTAEGSADADKGAAVPAAAGSAGPHPAAENSGDAAAAEGGGRFEILSVLESVIARRDAERPSGSYTTYLFTKGLDKILKKVGEESAEVIIAAKNEDNEELRCEASDLIFHLLVLLRSARLPLDDLMAELDRRHVRKAQG